MICTDLVPTPKEGPAALTSVKVMQACSTVTVTDVAECAVIGVEDSIKGEVPLGLIVLKSGVHRDHQVIVNECIERVREHVGPVAAFRKCVVVNQLPKTRSGKILRATLRQLANSLDFKVPPDNVSALDHVIERLNTFGYAKKHKEKAFVVNVLTLLII